MQILKLKFPFVYSVTSISSCWLIGTLMKPEAGLPMESNKCLKQIAFKVSGIGKDWGWGVGETRRAKVTWFVVLSHCVIQYF